MTDTRQRAAVYNSHRVISDWLTLTGFRTWWVVVQPPRRHYTTDRPHTDMNMSTQRRFGRS